MFALRANTCLFLLAALALAAVIYALASETKAFRAAVGESAARDLVTRTELATDALENPLETGDFRRIRAFGDECRAAGVRLTILSAPGGMIFDTDARAQGDHRDRPEIAAARAHGTASAFRRSATTGTDALYAAKRTRRGFVRLAICQSAVFAPADRALTPTLLAGLVGAGAFLIVYLFAHRLLARYRAALRERDDEKRKLAEMRRTEDFRRRFVSDVTHEIKTPLTGLIAAADLLESDAGFSADRKPLLGIIRREAARLNTLVRDVLALARLEQVPAEIPHAFAPADAEGIVREALDRNRPKALAAHIALTLGPVSPQPAFPCDAALVTQAIDNLIENAIRYSGSKDIVLSTTASATHLSFIVEDHGCGIPKEHAPHVFERFYRVDKARSRAEGGTGLGLAIVKHIALLHGGEARVEESSPHGTRVILALPLSHPQPENNKGKEKKR